MIIRKPYAFLIKNFRKIHIFMFLLCAFIYYKTITLSSFINEFMDLFSYDSYNEPISTYTGFLPMLALILLIASSIVLIILLKHKDKPWKAYLLPTIEYTALFLTFIFTAGYFNSYTGSSETTTIRAIRDVIFILTIPQYANFILLGIRIFGVDLNKFDFKTDKEYIELSEDDREEVEININIDKESIKRTYKRFKRNLGYFFQEHKLLVQAVSIILIIFVAYKSYNYIFVVNKSYSQGDIINTNGYTITINNSYYSDKDYKGSKISSGNGFVVLDLNIKNNSVKRTVNLNRFHIMNKSSNYSPTNKLYETEFNDLGKTVSELTLENGKENNLILIYKVSTKEDINRFVLYYQELNGNETHLRKIKLNITDLSEIKEQEAVNLGDVLTIKTKDEEKEIIFDNLEILKTVEYNAKSCSSSECSVTTKTKTAKDGYSILKLDFSSNDFAGKDMIDFLIKYGKINYIDNSKTKKGYKISNALNTYEYYGKYVYIAIPDEIANSSKIELVITVRNNKYTYKLK